MMFITPPQSVRSYRLAFLEMKRQSKCPANFEKGSESIFRRRWLGQRPAPGLSWLHARAPRGWGSQAVSCHASWWSVLSLCVHRVGKALIALAVFLLVIGAPFQADAASSRGGRSGGRMGGGFKKSTPRAEAEKAAAAAPGAAGAHSSGALHFVSHGIGRRCTPQDAAVPLSDTLRHARTQA